VPVDLHHAVGNHELGHAAAGGQAGGLEQVVQGDEFAAQIEGGVLHGVLEHFRKLGLLDGRQSVHNRALCVRP